MSMSPRHPVAPADDRLDGDVAPASESRRRFVRNMGLGAAAVGAVAATGASLTGVASAQTTATPPELDAADVDLLAFLQSIQLAAADALTTAADLPVLDSAVAEQLRGYVRHHKDQATTFGALLTEDEAVTAPNPTLLAQITGEIEGAADQEALVSVLYRFEEQLAATHLAAMGEADSWLVAGPVASILPIVGQMAAALGSTADLPTETWLPAFGSADGAFTPAAFPTR